MESSDSILNSFPVNCAKAETIGGVVFQLIRAFLSNMSKEGMVHDLSMLQISNNFDPDLHNLL